MAEEIRLLGPVLEWPIEQGENPTCKGHGKGWTYLPRSKSWACAEDTCFKISAGQLRYCEWCGEVWIAPSDSLVPETGPPRDLMHPICKNEFEGF